MRAIIAEFGSSNNAFLIVPLLDTFKIIQINTVGNNQAR